MKPYDSKAIEPKWQAVWDKTQIYAAKDDDPREKYYYLVEFPYPSGEGLHVGHVRSYTALDIMARHKRMQGFNVLYPMGWDAFGLPTENFAIKMKVAPQKVTKDNTDRFRQQMKELGLSFDWSREVNTTDPKYYKWTQWIFLQLHKAGLAYQAEIPINWCPFEKVGLANEEVVDGKHERCGTKVEKKLLKQWMLKITEYADRLQSDLKKVDYLDKIAVQQVNWIGRSEGAGVHFKLRGITGQDDDKHEVEVFTTRPDTLAGATFLVISPELAQKWIGIGWKAPKVVHDYITKAFAETDLQRLEQERPKSGVDAGITAINPITDKEIPVWVADYVLGSYGTGAIMAVPAHDERDFEFATKFKLPIVEVVKPPKDSKLPYMGIGKLVNSGSYDGLSSDEAKKKIVTDLEKDKQGHPEVQYKLRDWIFSRQHYWGEPIPIIHCPKCGVVPVPETDLPVVLPEVKSYEPTETGESPLAAMTDWVNVPCPNCNGAAQRETDTMPNWAGSSWYYLRYIDPDNDNALADPKKLKDWLMVDLYNGGMEHTTLHLLYSRFWHKFLYDQKIVPTPEPYARRRSHGMILGPDGQKMSKSRGNVITPDAIVAQYGADILRLYEMFMGPFDEMTSWSDERLAGIARFVSRVWNVAQGLIATPNAARSTLDANSGVLATEVDRFIHKTIKKVHEDIQDMHFNTMVSALMELTNFLTANLDRIKAQPDLADRTLRAFVLMLAPVAPHLAEELWEQLGEKESVHAQAWPKYDPELIKDDLIEVAIQVNGKLRGTVVLPTDSIEKDITEAAKDQESVKKHLHEKTVVKTIYVPRKLVNFVVKD